MVEARGLKKHFGQTRAVDGVSFTVSRGEVVGFLGPNAAGKTTTMRLLTGFLRPTDGQAFVSGIDVARERQLAQTKVGYLPENAPLYDDMMVLDFLNFVADLRGVPAPGRNNRLRQICERCGLMTRLGTDIGTLSKGYRQRVGLAQAMVHEPDLLILDEPTSGLDPNQIVEIRELIKDLGREKTVILSTHILQEVTATCSRVIIINDGRLVADDTPEALTDRDATAVIRLVVRGKNGAVLDALKLQQAFAGLRGVRAVEPIDGEGEGTLGFRLRASGPEDPRADVFSTAVAQNIVLLDLHRERVSLEDTFRRLTRGHGVPNA